MIDRRNFIARIGCAAASLQFATVACASVARGNLTTDLIASLGDYAYGTGAKIETLHRLSAQHPGFSYFSGLPGNLGMPFPELAEWCATLDAQVVWRELQYVCDVTCLIVGSASAVIACTEYGPYGVVARALTAAADTRSVASPNRIVPHGATLALTMPRSTWLRLDHRSQSAITTDANRLMRAHAAQKSVAANTTTSAINRIAEAVVAELSQHDSLTRRTNAHYFAFKATRAKMRSKNVV